MTESSREDLGRNDEGQVMSAGERLTQLAKEYLDTHSAEKFSLTAMAQALFVNGSYLLRSFKSQTGLTLLEYHHWVRCERAKTLLQDVRKSISEVGEEVGFVSSSHFAHIFRKVTGMTPTQYRASLNSQDSL